MFRKITFPVSRAKLKRLDALAVRQGRSRTELLNEAVDAYLDLQAYHIQMIKEGIREANEGKLIPHENVREVVAEFVVVTANTGRLPLSCPNPRKHCLS